MPLTVLIIEDDEMLRSLTVDAIELLGVDVVDCSTADDGLLELERIPSIKLLISDICLPGSLDGLALAKVVWARWPDLPIILTSGNRTVPEDELASNAMFMQKPWSLKALHNAVRKYLPV